MTVLVPVLVIAGAGLVCGTILAVAARLFHVFEDPRIEQVTALLPGINCGGCGYAGCAEYARAILKDRLPINLCKPGGTETVHKLAACLGVEALSQERQVAIVLCQGGDRYAGRKALYNGLADCQAAELAGGNGKACHYGCMGLGSCARICPVQAIEITGDNLALVHPLRCIGCGKCVGACPRHLIKLIPESRIVHILCSSRDKGAVTKGVCSVGCIACTLCVKTLGGQGMRMEGNLAVVDYSVPIENEAVIDKCPQHTIVRRSGRRETVPRPTA